MQFSIETRNETARLLVLGPEKPRPIDENTYRYYPLGPATLYVSDSDLRGFVHYLVHNPDNESGFGGAKYELTLESRNGHSPVVTLRGPWSSRAGIVNQSLPIAEHVIDVVAKPTPKAGGLATSMLVRALADRVRVERNIDDQGEITYVPKEVNPSCSYSSPASA